MEKQTKNNLIVALSCAFSLSFLVLGALFSPLSAPITKVNEIKQEMTTRKLDEPSYKRESQISDLTGTTWTLDDDLDFVNFGLVKYINFSSNGSTYTSLYTNQDDGIYFLYYGSPYVNVAYGSPNDDVGSTVWSANGYKSLYILGGDDVTNSQLISWLLANGTVETNTGGGDDDETPTGVYQPITLNKRYDFRKWLGEVDPLTGCIYFNGGSGVEHHYYNIGFLVINGVTYTHLDIATHPVSNAINIITGYDYQESAYLAMGGGDYYNGSTAYSFILSVMLLDGSSVPANNTLKMYQCPLIGARLKYDSGSLLSPTDYVPATGFLCSTFELRSEVLNWDNYIPSDTAYNLPGLSNNITVYQALSLDLINDTYMDFYSISAQSTGANVFTLISNAFKALAPILATQVIPGLPIGLLVTLPIVATVLVVVIKLVRK